VAVVFYLALAFSARQLALSLLAAHTDAPGLRYVFPEPLGAHRWRGAVKGESSWDVYLIDVPGRTVTPARSLPNDEASAAASAARDTPFGRRLEAFFKAPVWSVEAKPDGGATVSVHDLRFVSLVLPRPAPFRYEFDVAPGASSAKARGVRIW